MNQNDIVTVLTPVGEMIGRLVSNDNDVVVLQDPKTLMQTQQGMGFAPSICMSASPVKNVEIQKAQVIAIVPTVKEIADGWIQSTSGIVLS